MQTTWLSTPLTNPLRKRFDRGLDLAPAKSRYMIFTRKRTYQLPEENITINGVEVPLTNEHRVLGIILDSKLTGKAHIKYLLNKGRKISSILTVLSEFRWGAHPQLLLTLYRSVFRSAIEYGCVVFKLKGNKQLFLAIQRLQWKLLRCAMGYRMSTPINVILDETKEPPLSYRFTYLIHNYLVKGLSCSFNPVIESLKNIQFSTNYSAIKRNKACRLIPLFRSFLAVQDLPEFLQFSNPNINHMSTREVNSLFRETFAEYIQGSIIFFTDGSKIDSSRAVGASVYSLDLPLEIRCKLPPDASTFSAEAWAIYEALFIIHQLQIPSTIIFSDCKSVLQIKMAWIPSHKGIVGNERADTLAKEAITIGRKTNFKNAGFSLSVDMSAGCPLNIILKTESEFLLSILNGPSYGWSNGLLVLS
ncbi:Gag-Pol polyprotein, partial [Temnothorax longispinosus]